MATKSPTRLVPLAGLSDTQRKSLGLGGWKGPRVREENEVLSRMYPVKDKVQWRRVHDGTYYRNDGHKHIKSVGAPC